PLPAPQCPVGTGHPRPACPDGVRSESMVCNGYRGCMAGGRRIRAAPLRTRAATVQRGPGDGRSLRRNPGYGRKNPGSGTMTGRLIVLGAASAIGDAVVGQALAD